MFKPRFRRAPRLHAAGPYAPAAMSHLRSTERETRQGRCVALVDARFMGWLQEPDTPEHLSGAADPSAAMLRQFRLLLAHAGLDLEVVRVYWYSDKPQVALTDDVVHRAVPHPAQDAGQGMVRAMAADMARLAECKAAEHLLLASDDERLWAGVDAAQLAGLSVHVLCDDSVADFARLQQDDPSWARLLAQADRRVPWMADVASPTSGSGDTAADEERVAEDSREQILAHIARWWSDEPETQRHDLRDELQQARSIPQEVDRQLLLLLSRELAHPLSWPEKKIMREGVRRIVLGGEYTPYRHPAGVENAEI